MGKKEELMSNEEIHKYGIGVIESYLKNRGYTILEENFDYESDPQLIIQKSLDMAFVIIRTYMYPKKFEKIDMNKYDSIIRTAKSHDAKCYIANIGLAYADAMKPKELSKPYKNGNYIVKFKGLEEINM